MKITANSLLWPEPLNPGDTVALTAPSSPVSEKNLMTAIASLKYLRLKPIIMDSCRSHLGYLAGTDRQRASDINDAFASEDIKAVFCLRGGYGAMRILPLLDFDMIRNHPKLLIGYSDITALHTAINSRCSFVTLHGPMPNTGYEQLDEFSINSMKRILFQKKEQYIIKNPPGQQMKTLCPGCAEGLLTGGNLSLLASTLGSPYEIDTHGKLLFIEEVDEIPYKLDRALTALSLAGKFKDCSGIILGTFTNCMNSDHSTNGNTAAGDSTSQIMDIIKEIVLPWEKPTLFNLRAGHIYPQCTLPLGAIVRIELDRSRSPNISVL